VWPEIWLGKAHKFSHLSLLSFFLFVNDSVAAPPDLESGKGGYSKKRIYTVNINGPIFEI
jgi:hypothetical protein